MLPPSKRLTCYLYEIVDDLGTIRYVGKGTGKRRFTHSRIVDGLITGRITRNAAYVHRQMAAAIQAGRTFSVRVIAEHLSAETAYAIEIKRIAELGREMDGTGSLWNLLPGGAGYDYGELPAGARSEIARKAANNAWANTLRKNYTAEEWSAKTRKAANAYWARRPSSTRPM